MAIKLCMSLATIGCQKRIFSFDQAKQLMPIIQQITAKTATEIDLLTNELTQMTPGTPVFQKSAELIDDKVRRWVDKIHKLGAYAKGLWLVDFDNGQGYYCWSYPEDSLEHFHSYDEGFQTRTKII